MMQNEEETLKVKKSKKRSHYSIATPLENYILRHTKFELVPMFIA